MIIKYVKLDSGVNDEIAIKVEVNKFENHIDGSVLYANLKHFAIMIHILHIELKRMSHLNHQFFQKIAIDI